MKEESVIIYNAGNPKLDRMAQVVSLGDFREVVDNLKCCGNCNHYAKRSDCVTKHEYLPYRYCEQWQSDGMTRKEREG